MNAPAPQPRFAPIIRSALPSSRRNLLFLIAGLVSAACMAAGQEPAEMPGSLERAAFGPLQPRLSPGGTEVAFSWQGAICRMDLASGATVVLTAGEWTDVDPAWAPDERSLFFVNSPNFTWGQLRRVNAADGAALPVPKCNAQGPLWCHPDGRRVLGHFSRQGPPHQVAWLNLESGEITPLPAIRQTGAAFRFPITLSRDGQSVLLPHSLLPLTSPSQRGHRQACAFGGGLRPRWETASL